MRMRTVGTLAIVGLLLTALPVAAVPHAACSGKCWPVGTNNCSNCGLSAFVSRLCADGQRGDFCWCEEYACPSDALLKDTESGKGANGKGPRGAQPSPLKVVKVELPPRV